MCFSAGASFTAGVLLTFVGTETLRKVHKPSQLALASLPVFFAAQQFTEGVLWSVIGQPKHASLQAVATHVFLIMAQVVWPVLIPLSVRLLEENRIRKKILSVLFTVGVAIGLYYCYQIATHTVRAEIIERHVVYEDTRPDLQGLITISLYLAATIAPLFVSSTRRIHVLGLIMSASFIVAAVFYVRCLTSVWCFFAAVISFAVFYLIRDAHKKFHVSPSIKLTGKVVRSG